GRPGHSRRTRREWAAPGWRSARLRQLGHHDAPAGGSARRAGLHFRADRRLIAAQATDGPRGRAVGGDGGGRELAAAARWWSWATSWHRIPAAGPERAG